MLSSINHPVLIPDILRECFAKTIIASVPFLRVYPDKEMTGPLIVWRMVRRWPGKDKKETKRGRIRAMSETDPDKTVMYFGQWQTAMFQFDLIHINNTEADRLMFNFEQAVRECQPTLADHGIDTFFFEEQLEDTSLPISKALVSRSLRYMATMTVYTPVNVARMREIIVNVSQTPFNSTLTVVKSSGDTDIIVMKLADLISIRSVESDETSTYLGSGIDYVAEDLNDGTIQITWTDFGLRPLPGNDFYISHSSISDPVTRVVH